MTEAVLEQRGGLRRDCREPGLVLESYCDVIRPKGSAMAMEATTIRFAPEEKAWIQSYCDFVGKSFSDVVREAVLEKVEDEADLLAYREALEEDDGEYITMEELLEKLGMD